MILLVTLAFSSVISFCGWQLGWARMVSPGHPLFTTVLMAAGVAAMVQVMLERDRKRVLQRTRR